MAVINLLQRQIERRAELLCHSRNRSLPVDMGKSSFEPIENGVQFIQHHYKLDSVHSEYSTVVARIVRDDEENNWALYIPSREELEGESNLWVPYPFLSKSGDLTALMREIEKDPKSYFWT